jgi:lipopolysaccharide/colanic/teichoic acid biosynthesis glycosyltransferase
MAKRAFDVAVVTAFAPLWVAVMLGTAAVLAVHQRGNPFFVQQRVGLGGKPFTMVKLRTMRNPHPGEREERVVRDWGSYLFSPTDQRHPRLTRLGVFVRKASLDEVPNLINVLKGEMSLVGPRPEQPELVRQYPPSYHRRHDVKPGMTGLAQIHGRSDLHYHDKLTYDLEYVDNHPFRRDLAILWRTFLMVPFGTGAR